jgi:hypothetical protein
MLTLAFISYQEGFCEPFRDHVRTGMNARLPQRHRARIDELVGHTGKYHNELPACEQSVTQQVQENAV